MEIQKKKVSEINPAAYNPRKDLQPGDPEYEKLKKSILEFDMVEPLVWNKRTNNLVGGHQRLKILKELEIELEAARVAPLTIDQMKPTWRERRQRYLEEVGQAVVKREEGPDGSRGLIRWIIGDSKNIDTLAQGEYDLIFSCPPYYDLEVYSDLEGELSALPSYSDFIKAYRGIVAKSVAMLKDNRFACFVVGDIRDKRGFYRNLVSDTIGAFQDAGMQLYNEAILVTTLGSLPIRITRAFQAGRKLGKTHQNVLVFYKGDPEQVKTFGEVEVGEPDETNTEAGNILFKIL